MSSPREDHIFHNDFWSVLVFSQKGTGCGFAQGRHTRFQYSRGKKVIVEKILVKKCLVEKNLVQKLLVERGRSGGNTASPKQRAGPPTQDARGETIQGQPLRSNTTGA